MSDIVKLYNPANAAALSPEEIAGLQNLSSDEIKTLARAYPNSVMQKAYLLIIDSSKPVEKQLPTLSTFENLWNLRERNGLKKYVAYNFKGVFKARPVPHIGAKRPEVVDLSEIELMNIPGLKIKTGGKETQVTQPETVQVTEIKKRTGRPKKITNA